MKKQHERDTRWVGAQAENYAMAHLQRLGYRIVGRNQQFPCGELDIVAFEREILCFIEVRHRSDGSHGGALSSITRSKQRKITRAAACYLQHLTLPWPPCRFDVVALEGTPPGWRMFLLRGAFEVTS